MQISVALDIGNSGGKVFAATMDRGHLEILDERIIPNETVLVNGRMYWDLFRLFRDLKTAMREYAEMGTVVSVAVDATAGAYAFVNRTGSLASYIVSMMSDTDGDWRTWIEKKMTLRSLYDRTGVFPIRFNVLNRLTKEFGSGDLDPHMEAQFAPASALFEFMLTGGLSVEHSMAGASVMMDAGFRDWNRPLLEELGIPDRMMPEIIPPGTIGKPLLRDVALETNCPECRFIHTVEFDSATAMISAPGFDDDQIYLSMGTTINPGVQLPEPVISEEAWKYRYKNAPVWPGSVMLMSDVPGFYIAEACLDAWRKGDPAIGHGELVERAEKAFCPSAVNVFDPVFADRNSGMPETIAQYCRKTGQQVPSGIGETACVLYRSYAAAIAWSVEKLKCITKRDDYRSVIAISGGSRNALLCQMIADATGMTVRAGDPKVTCLGNLLVQFYALGKLKDRRGMQEEAERICPMRTYLPKEDETTKRAVGLIRQQME